MRRRLLLENKLAAIASNETNDNNTAPDTFVSWNKFLHLNSIMKYQCGTERMFIDMWIGFIDPYNEGMVEVEPLRDLFEQLARGKYTFEPTLISIGFSTAIISILKLKSKNHYINSLEVRKAFENHQIDISLFNQTLQPHCEFKGITEILETALYENL